MEKYVVKSEKGFSKAMSRDEAINMVKDFDSKGVSAYIISEDEAQRIGNSEFNTPKWE